MSDPTYVRTERKWSNVCLLVDLRNREIVGHSVGDRRDSDLMKAAFATVGGSRYPTSRCSTRTVRMLPAGFAATETVPHPAVGTASQHPDLHTD